MALTRESGPFSPGYKPQGNSVPNPNLDTTRGSSATWPSGITENQMIELCNLLIVKCQAKINEPGDLANQVVNNLGTFRDAIKQNWKHGRNWYAKYGEALQSELRSLLPDFLGVPAKAPLKAQKEFEGKQLEGLVMHVFPDANRGAISTRPRAYTVGDEED